MGEGACLAPRELSSSIFVTHWGRLAHPPPNHSTTYRQNGWRVPPWHEKMYGAVRCFEPGKDVLLPVYKSRPFVQSSPFLTGRKLKRSILFNFRGNMHLRDPSFSFGLRQ